MVLKIVITKPEQVVIALKREKAYEINNVLLLEYQI